MALSDAESYAFSESEEETYNNFSSFGLDTRLVKAVHAQKIVTPTEVQQKAIPVALQRQDIMMKAKTGSGKTLAFVLPILQQILNAKASRPPSDSMLSQGPRALILAPTQELIFQIGNVMNSLLKYADDAISGLALIQQGLLGMQNERPRLQEGPDIVICTPTRLAAHLEAENVSLEFVEHIVVDEADLLMAEDYEADIRTIVAALQSNPRRPQMIMCSATLNVNTAKVQHWFLMHSPRMINLADFGEDPKGLDNEKLTEYLFQCPYRKDKFLIMYGLLRLNIISGKSIIFCCSLDFGYRLKLFLERFLIRTAVLNPMLPIKSRQDIISKFNKGIITHLITTDSISMHDDRSNIMNYWVRPADEEQEFGPAYSVKSDANPFDSGSMKSDGGSQAAVSEAHSDTQSAGQSESEFDFEDEADDVMTTKRRKKHQMAHSQQHSLSREQMDNLPLLEAQGQVQYRGVDFREVAAVINFTAPRTLQSYVHRAGRTARGGNYGVVITLCNHKEWDTWFRHKVYNKRVLRDNEGAVKEHRIQPLPLTMDDLSSFTYRCNSVRASITPKLIKMARLNELRMEILNAKRLHSQFRERTRDFELKRHDSMLQPHTLIKPNMSQVPRYTLAGTVLQLQRTEKDRKQESGFNRYKKVFGRLPPRAEKMRKKRRFKYAMKLNPALKAKVEQKRLRMMRKLRNRKSPNKQGRNVRKKIWEQGGLGYLKKMTAGPMAGSKRSEQNKGRTFVRKVGVKNWREALRTNRVPGRRNKISNYGLNKVQYKIIKQRQKQRKMGRRRK